MVSEDIKLNIIIIANINKTTKLRKLHTYIPYFQQLIIWGLNDDDDDSKIGIVTRCMCGSHYPLQQTNRNSAHGFF